MKKSDYEKIKKVVENNGMHLRKVLVGEEPDEKLEYPVVVIVDTLNSVKRSLINMDLEMLELDSFPFNPYYFKVRGEL